MKRYIYIIAIVLIAGMGLISCSDFLEPEPDNRYSEEQLMKDPSFVEGLLINAYAALPSNYDFKLDIASDDAVSNTQVSGNVQYPVVKMARGEWTAQNNPVSTWETAYLQIFYINSFLERVDKIKWSSASTKIDALDKQRLKGEANALRAWYEFQLLQSHAGKDASGNLLGFPVVDKVIKLEDNYKLPRNSFTDCVAQIVKDCDAAIANLPNNYVNSGDAEYDAAMGARWLNRMDGYSVRALKARVLLYAASPAYNPTGDAAKWVNAAKEAGSLYLAAKGVPANLATTGLTFYVYGSGPANYDVIWSRAVSQSLTLEQANFAPSLVGAGNTNPTQELVDAFPMKNGYPITHPSSTYNASDPYANRDPRLAAYILYDGATFGTKGVIRTYTGAPVNGVNVQTNSTRTGYYLRKFLLDAVKLETPQTTQLHFYTFLRYTEVLLNFAEAANEAWGPDADGASVGFTARKAIAEIRKRAGITQPDVYLAEVTSKDDFRKLVRNERRLELCFEGHRFWDIRRWNDLTSMKASVKGAFRQGVAGSFIYSNVEDRVYKDYMIYGPIPYTETLKYEVLVQNNGW
jgi:starch-binding outer membrane protein, SusD/RagB family